MKVSIIIPVYNVAEYIADCLESVYHQSYQHIEVVIVNDCTPDNSMEVAVNVLDRLKERFEVVVVEHEQNGGLSVARNTGVDKCSGEWVYFLDSDDELPPLAIEKLVDLVNRFPGVDFTMGRITVIGSDCCYAIRSNEYLSNNAEVLEGFLKNEWFVMACNKLIRKSYIVDNSLSFVPRLLHEDNLYSFYLAATASSMASTTDETYIYKMRNEGSITSSRGVNNFRAYYSTMSQIVEYMSQNRERFKRLSVLEYISSNVLFIMILLERSKAISRDQRREFQALYLDLFRSSKSLLKELSGDNISVAARRNCAVLALGRWAVYMLSMLK